MSRRPVVLVLLALLTVPAAATAASLPSVASGHRPGPDALYAPEAAAPQLENAAPWRAAPILVSGAAAYRDGEFLYQDHLYDDHGALGVRDPGDPFGATDFLFSPKAGTLTYPTDRAFANNAADLVELRVRPLTDATAFRVTLNTLEDAERTAVTIALGASDAARPWPHGAGVSSPAALFLTVHGSTAELRDAASGAVLAPGPTASVDLRRRQIDVRIPHGAWNPARSTVRMAAGVGLWDRAAGRYLAPGLEASADAPGGAAPTGAALFNVGFRFAEPLPDVTQFGAGITIADAAVGALVDRAWWREKAQADALLLGDISPFFADVDFGKLLDGVDDDARVPKTGSIVRILASRYDAGRGVDHARVCFTIGGESSLPASCEGRFLGQLHPYTLYVPAKPRPAGGWGFTLLLHSLSANYSQYAGSKNQSQLGDRGAGSLVATPSGRGPDGFYIDLPEAETFEVWADVARHYPLDPDWSAVSGYSMGGYGTWRLLARYPDLFARGMSTVGPVSGAGVDMLPSLPSLRNTPVMAWAAAADELVPVTGTEETAGALGDLGLSFVADLFPAADHLTLATNDEYGPAAEFLGSHRVDREPAHVTYVVEPGSDSARGAVVADHAYWLSDLRLHDTTAERGTIDVRSEAFGVGDPQPSGVATGAGVLTGGAHGPLPYVHRQQAHGPVPKTEKADRLVVWARNVATATVDARRARVSCAPTVAVDSNGPLDLRIACPPPRRPARCKRTVTFRLPRLRGARVVAVIALRDKRVVKRVRGRNLRRVALRRPRRGAFTVRLRLRTSRAGRVVTVIRRVRACS